MAEHQMVCFAQKGQGWESSVQGLNTLRESEGAMECQIVIAARDRRSAEIIPMSN